MSGITPAEIAHCGGLQVTTIARTIAHIAFAGLADDLVIQATQEAVVRGLASTEQLLAARAATDHTPYLARYLHSGVVTFRFESVSRLPEVATVAGLTGARQTWRFGVK